MSNNQDDIQEWYEQNKKKCLNCGEYIPFKGEPFSNYKIKKFCNNSCAASYNNKKRISRRKILYCLNCGKELPKSAKKFCSPRCQNDYYYKEYISKWKNGEENGLSGEYQLSSYIERYIREKYNYQCARCGWHEINPITGKSPLEIEHIDGDYTNNKEENLILLCPNCHSLTPTYKALNKGKGRKGRNKYNLPHTINYKNKENN